MASRQWAASVVNAENSKPRQHQLSLPGLQGVPLILLGQRQQRGLGEKCPVLRVSSIAEDLDLGTTVMPIVNSTMLGAFAMVSRMVDMASLSLAIQKNISVRSDDNMAGARKAYEMVSSSSLKTPS